MAAIDDMKLKSDDQLQSQLGELKREQFNLRFQSATNQLEKPSRVRVVRRTIARIRTLQNQRARAQANAAAAGRRGLAIDVVDQHQRPRGGGDAQDDRGHHQRMAGAKVARVDQPRQRVDHQLQPKHAADRGIDRADAALALVGPAARVGQAVEHADPHQVARGLGISGEHRIGRDRGQPRPAAGQREGGEQHLLIVEQAAAPKLPQHQRGEQRCRQRVGPEGDQRVHMPPNVNFTDMLPTVAKLYKYCLNGSPLSLPRRCVKEG